MSEPFLDVVRRSWLLFSVLLLLLGMVGWSIWIQNKLTGRVAAIENTIKSQTALLNRAFGNGLPVKMPQEWEDSLNKLEVQIANSDRWPKDTTEAEQFLDQVSELVTSLPAWAEADYLPRLSLVRWAAMAFSSLRRSQNPNEPPNDLAEEMRILADAKPNGDVSDLDQRLQNTAADLVDRTEKKMIEEAIQQAQKYEVEDTNTQQDSNEVEPDIASLYDFLGLYENDPAQGTIIAGLRKKLYKRMVIRQAEQQVSMLKAQWNTVQALEKSQPAVYEAAVSTVLLDVTAARVALVREGVKQPIYDKLESELYRAVEKQQSETKQKYQDWALKKIREFKNEFQRVSEEAKQVSEEANQGSDEAEDDSWTQQASKAAKQVKKVARQAVAPFVNNWSDRHYQAIQDAMISHLLPIDSAFLELPVLKLYRQAFEIGWRTLDGRDYQTVVAEKWALKKKEPLRTFLEGQS